jgi:prepilin-type N-terminal cleavage/methylation domain-containing protein
MVKRTHKNGTKQQGFTLVEMSLVLVVVGLILGAASIGRDLQRNAEYKKVQKNFIDQWELAYYEHYDRIGVVVGDDPAYPTDVINFLAVTDAAAQEQLLDHPPGGFTFSQTAIPELCGDQVTQAVYLRDYLIDAGIDMPSGRAYQQEDKYLFLDPNGNPQQVTVCFQWLIPVADGPGAGNTMLIRGLTPDLAKMLDSAIDGRAEGTRGRFRCVTDGDVTEEACEWPANVDDDVAFTTPVMAAYRMFK